MKVLVVDDSTTMRRIICNTLNSALKSPVIIEAGDGEDGFAQYQKNTDVNIILTDWNMPKMNGLAFLEKVREVNKEVPIVMVTTEAEKQNVVTAIKAGANTYVVKPFTPEVLQEKLRPFLS
ncbi:MAG: response regulator [Planctomycetes bacterium]|nr:response regulator [Planctomycetota bacterium]